MRYEAIDVVGGVPMRTEITQCSGLPAHCMCYRLGPVRRWRVSMTSSLHLFYVITCVAIANGQAWKVADAQGRLASQSKGA